MINKIYTIEEIKQIITPIVQKYPIKSMYLFGSYARGEATSESDIDFRFDAEKINSYIGLSDLYINLEESLGKEIDVMRTENLDLEVLFNICDEEVLIYDRW